jgi:hypothetical protein
MVWRHPCITIRYDKAVLFGKVLSNMLAWMHKAEHIKAKIPPLAHVRKRTQIVLCCKLPDRNLKFKKVRNMYVLQNVVKKDKPTKKQMARVKQQLEVEYWLSQALESGCFSLECSG